MARLLDDAQYTTQHAFEFEKKLNSHYVIYQDKNAQPVVYYNINEPESTVDEGLYTAERDLGTHSPTRFNRIDGLPIYIDSNILLDLEDADEGLTTSFQADGTLLPNTVIPYPGDYFFIKYLGNKFVFRVNEISFDTVKSYNYYKISFSIKSVNNRDSFEDLEGQTINRFICIQRNIGTDEKCIIEESDYVSIQILNEAYDVITDMYLKLFYHDDYNVLLYNDEAGRNIYDRYMTRFINNNHIFAKKYDYISTLLSEVDFDRFFITDYSRSLYRLLELGRYKDIKDAPFILINIKDPISIFSMYNDKNIYSVQLMNKNVGQWYLPGKLFNELDKAKLTQVDLEIKKDENPRFIRQTFDSSLPSQNSTPFSIYTYGPPGPADSFNKQIYNNTKPTNTTNDFLKPNPKKNANLDDYFDISPDDIDETYPDNDSIKKTYKDYSPDDIEIPDKIDYNTKKDKYTDLSSEDIGDKGEDKKSTIHELSSEDVDYDNSEYELTKKPELPIDKKIISDYLKGKILDIKNINVEKLRAIEFLDYNWDTFVGIPILLYILTQIYKEYMRKEEVMN